MSKKLYIIRRYLDKCHKFINEEENIEECVVGVSDFQWLVDRTERLEKALRYYANDLQEDDAVLMDYINDGKFGKVAQEALRE